MRYAPIALFACSRPGHTLGALASLAANLEALYSELFVFCDAPKNPGQEQAAATVREIVRSRQWCGSVNVIEREENRGCAGSIMAGVSQLCKEYGKVIVVEDDLILSPYFLGYMNAALDRYASAMEVVQVSGHMFPVEAPSDTDAFFLPFTTSWGWATWQRAWECFDPDMTGYDLLKNDQALLDRFNLDQAYDFFGMLGAQRAGRVDSWAIRWYLSTFLIGGLTLYPRKTLVENAGFDGSGTHYSHASGGPRPGTPDFRVESFPEKIFPQEDWAARIREYLRQPPKPQSSLLANMGRAFRKIWTS